MPITSLRLATALLAALKAAGFTISTPATAEFPAGIVWPVRARTHRYLSGRSLRDHRSTIQFGGNEEKAALVGMGELITLEWTQANAVANGNADNVSKYTAAPCWINGPGTRWVAEGNQHQFLAAMVAWKASKVGQQCHRNANGIPTSSPTTSGV